MASHTQNTKYNYGEQCLVSILFDNMCEYHSPFTFGVAATFAPTIRTKLPLMPLGVTIQTLRDSSDYITFCPGTRISSKGRDVICPGRLVLAFRANRAISFALDSWYCAA